MRVQPVAGAADERPRRQPRPHLRRPWPDRRGEQVLGGPVRVRAGGQAGAVVGVRHLADQHPAQLGDQLRQLVEPGRHVAAGAGLGEQGEGERVAAAERGEPAALVLGHAEPAEQLDALRRRQHGQVEPAQQLPPARVGRPGGVRRLPPGQHDHRVGRQRRQQVLAEPPVQPGEQLVPVDQQHRPRAVRQRGDRAGHVLDGAAEIPAVQQQRRPLRLHRAAAQLVEQRGLADAAGTVHEQHPGRLGAGQRGGERAEFRSAPDEASAAGVVEDGGEGRAHRSCSSQVRRSC